MADQEENGLGRRLLQVFRSALAALRSRSSIASITTARRGDMEEVVENSRCGLRT